MGLGKRAKDVVLAGSYLWPVPSTALMHKLYQYWFLFWGKAPDLSHQSLVWALLCRSWSGGQILPGDTAALEKGAMSPEREEVECAGGGGAVQEIWAKNLNMCSEGHSDCLSLWKLIYFSSENFPPIVLLITSSSLELLLFGYWRFWKGSLNYLCSLLFSFSFSFCSFFFSLSSEF